MNHTLTKIFYKELKVKEEKLDPINSVLILASFTHKNIVDPKKEREKLLCTIDC